MWLKDQDSNLEGIATDWLTANCLTVRLSLNMYINLYALRPLISFGYLFESRFDTLAPGAGLEPTLSR